MTTRISILTTLAVAVSGAAAQSDYTGPATLVFAMDNDVALNSTHTGIAAAVGDDAILVYSPGNQAFALPLCDFGAWAAFFGDEDGDGDYTENIISAVDAIWAPPGAPTPPSVFDLFLSVQSSTGTDGYLGRSLRDGDIFRLTTTGIEILISNVQIGAAMGGSGGADVTGFTVDPATGDFYLTFEGSHAVGTATLEDGGVMRIPGSAMTLTGGLVTAVAAGSAEIVLTEPEVNAMFLNAGFDGVSETSGIEIDPTGGTFTSPVTGLTMPNLWLCDDDSDDEGFVSTRTDPVNTLPGVVPSVNGHPMRSGNGMGLGSVDPSGGTVDNPAAIAFQAADPTGPQPLHVDVSPVGSITPATFQLDLSGASPGGFVVFVGELFDGVLVDGFPARSGSAPVPLPSPSWLEFYPLFPTSGVISLQVADAEGFAGFSLPIGFPLPAGIGVVWQAAELPSFTLSSPAVMVTQ